MNTKPEDYMSGLMSEYMEKVENENLIPYPQNRWKYFFWNLFQRLQSWWLCDIIVISK